MRLTPEFIEEMRRNLRSEVRLDKASRILYSTDASIYQIEPLGVFIPRDLDELQGAVEIAARHEVPILARGSGSSLAGQAIGSALILDCSRWLDRIVQIDAEARTAIIEPGVILAALNSALAPYGLMFGPDPASSERATLGGVIANNATGAHSIRYGMAADHLKEAEVILADGSRSTWGEIPTRDLGVQQSNESMNAIHAVINRVRERAEPIQRNFPRSWRNSAGYRINYLLPWSPSRPPQWQSESYPDLTPRTLNLASLLAGSEGTLAIIRRATLNLVHKPRHTVLAVLGYAGIDTACDDIPRLLGYEPSAIELIPRSIVRLARSVPAYATQAAILEMDAEALLIVEFSGDELSKINGAATALNPALLAESSADQARIWNVRKVGLGLLASRTGDSKTVAFIEDCAIPVEQLGGFVRGLERILKEYGVSAEYYAHASAGCLHIRPILNLKREVNTLRSIAEATLELTLSLGGSMSSEHGDGLARSEWLQKTYGEEVIGAFRALKTAADPKGILNPGKILNAPPMDSNLRYGTTYRSRAWKTPLGFGYEGSLEQAIEQCNGQGVCRKFDGTMCPSFQATREEKFSTRGRANLLRALISGIAGEMPLEAVHNALDLCLACKGCKSECPSGVDMAKLKFSFEAEYFRTHQRQLRDYIFGYFHTFSSLIAPFAPLVNASLGFPLTSRIITRLTGISAKRPFPTYSLKRAKVKSPSSGMAGPTVLFLPDAFTHFLEPQVEQAAFDLLALAGIQVKVLPLVGAGASLLSKGFLDAAGRRARQVLDAILEIDPAGVCSVIGLEPPEISMLKYDLEWLVPDRKQELAAFTGRIWLMDDFLLRSQRIKEIRIAINQKTSASILEKKICFHPHCHQRAEPPSEDGLPFGTHTTVALLRACGFKNVEVIEAGCCGMAGTFGYEAEHFELSQKVGELKLFPNIRKQIKTEDEVHFLSSGSACRMQIEQGTGVTAEHPLTFLARHL